MFCIGNFLRKKCIFDYCDCRSNDQAAKMAFEEWKGLENDTRLPDELGMESTVRVLFVSEKS